MRPVAAVTAAGALSGSRSGTIIAGTNPGADPASARST